MDFVEAFESTTSDPATDGGKPRVTMVTALAFFVPLPSASRGVDRRYRGVVVGSNRRVCR